MDAMRWVTVALAPVLLLAGGLALAQGQAPAATELRGRIEAMTDSELIVRDDNGRLHFVDTAAMPSADLGLLNPGDEIAVRIRAHSPRGPIGHAVRRTQPAPPPR
jgi:hypothetical protein